MRGNGRSSKKKIDNDKLSAKNLPLDSSENILTYWNKATCDSRFCVLDVCEQKTYSLEQTSSNLGIWIRTHNHMKTRMDSKHSEAICVRCKAGIRIFFENLSGQGMYFPKPANRLSKRVALDSPFCSWTVRSVERSHF